jgi:hypothetical protein
VQGSHSAGPRAGARPTRRDVRREDRCSLRVGAPVLRGISLRSVPLRSALDWMFLIFGLVLVATAVKILRDAVSGHDHAVDVDVLRSVLLARRFFR